MSTKTSREIASRLVDAMMGPIADIIGEIQEDAMMGPIADIIGEIQEDAREQAMEQVQQVLNKSLSGQFKNFGNKPMKAAKGKARAYYHRPCPVKRCKNEAFPRFKQVCKDHYGTLSDDDIVLLRAKAERPGGVWYKMGIGKYAKADEKKAAKAKAADQAS